jgi:hypothetical protein
MAKQVKIGFERVPVPKTETLEILYDRNTGIPLKSSNGGFLYTKEQSPVPKFGSSKNSLSAHINNETTGPVKILEQFPETSQVSSTLLGIPRAETQLGLFSDVSIYGLDDDIWEFYRNPVPNQPIDWITRKNPTYGPRYYQRLEEVSNEQGLAITGFPTPWTFPFGPRFKDVGGYSEPAFLRYQKFIELGNEYFDFYNSRGFIDFAKNNFLERKYASVLPEEKDVFYNEEIYSLAVIFAEIEKWTLTWIKLRDGKLFDPESKRISFIPSYDATNTSPGYSSQANYYAELQSKRVFRYQPGRISGFTFGVRASSDAGSVQNVIEWGCANTSDQYMFQIKGSQFNLIRRSTIALPEKNLLRMRLDPNPTTGDQRLKDGLWETVISRDKFNGDSLDGNGASGYIISFEEVTMYKIEFSWYGAIGAKFYAYVPVGNGDARWVLIHTVVIENELGQPCLQDPFFKFKYVLNITDTSNLTFPQYIYKYGASYYIDGGDEGTVTSHSYTSNYTNINSTNSRSLLGITAKDVIFNSQGIGNKNRKDVMPVKMTVSSTEAAKIDIIECEGCPGHSHHYAPGLRSGVSGVVGNIVIDSTGSTLLFEPTDQSVAFEDYIYNDDAVYSKVIGDGLYDLYLYRLPDQKIGIARRSANSVNNNNPLKSITYENTEQVRLANGELKNIKNTLFENVRIAKWNHITASSVPLVKKNINVNFLNVGPRDTARSFAEFFIGVTEKTPAVNITSGELEFNNEQLDISDLLFVEYAPYSANKDIKGFDIAEWDPRTGNVFEMDYRLRSPPGVDSGRCSQANIVVDELSFDAEYANVNPITQSPGNFLIFQTAALSSLNNLDGGELASLSEITGKLEGLGIFFTENRVGTFQNPTTQALRYFITISGPLNSTAVTKLYLKVVSVSGLYVNNSKVFTWDLYPLYVVIGMRDNSAINNITIQEFDDISKFSHTPLWLKSTDSLIEVKYSGIINEGINPSTGLYQAGGLSDEGFPAENFVSINRLDSAQIDSQLQQPLRPGQIRSSFYIGTNETLEVDLTHVFGQDRYVITPGTLNTSATFITAKTIENPGEIQISINTKEQ